MRSIKQLNRRQILYALALNSVFCQFYFKGVMYCGSGINGSCSKINRWVDTLPPARVSQPTTTNIYNSHTRSPRRFLTKDLSIQSDDGSSRCSSVESVLELRKPDPEAVLLGLGFGPSNNSTSASRIPDRFLQPSKILPQIDFNKFLEQCGQKLPEQHSCPSSPARPRPKSY
ncbi:hypothetical protein NQ318_000751 [Aromia moschata]|uniref:ITPR-interacting domain-containing protein n=1 Tax=Aromia moschata TaxID=1265417 RepID=A0AAV8YSW8_9CUCU|nr:hypothetical protein NQ318_000751 [Aromia moschata]